MAKTEKNNIEKIFSQVISKCWVDKSYLERLVENPILAIKEIDPNFEMSSDKTLVVRDQTNKKTLYINIPSMRNMENAELTADELEAVAGGRRLPYVKMISLNDFVSNFTTKKFLSNFSPKKLDY